MDTANTLIPGTFAELYCKQNGCGSERCVEQLLLRSLPWFVMPIGKLILALNRPYFSREIHLVQRVGQSRTIDETVDEISGYGYEQRRDFKANSIRIRISTRKLLQLQRDTITPPHDTVLDGVR